MGCLMNFTRQIAKNIAEALARGKSILLLGPRQTGKTTLIQSLNYDFYLNFLQIKTRRRYERYPDSFLEEMRAFALTISHRPLIILDEIQKIPMLLDSVQILIDEGVAQFVLTGSSARKLRAQGVNLLPGRVVSLRMDPLIKEEYESAHVALETLLIDGALPGILSLSQSQDREIDLKSYAETYLEEEVRQEAIVRSLGSFTHFLELAALESGNIVNFKKISQDIGVAHTTIQSYYQVLEDCLIVERIMPLVKGIRKKLVRSPRFLFFDLGVQRVTALLAAQMPRDELGRRFEQFVGLEILRILRLKSPLARLLFWRDSNGIEVDWVVQKGGQLIPIEVKLKETPDDNDARHLKIFLQEYPSAKQAYVVSNTTIAYDLRPNIKVIPWGKIAEYLEDETI